MTPGRTRKTLGELAALLKLEGRDAVLKLLGDSPILAPGLISLCGLVRSG